MPLNATPAATASFRRVMTGPPSGKNMAPLPNAVTLLCFARFDAGHLAIGSWPRYADAAGNRVCKSLEGRHMLNALVTAAMSLSVVAATADPAPANPSEATIAQIRAAVQKYKDVKVALADGYIED